jgi:hypothetical protein
LPSNVDVVTPTNVAWGGRPGTLSRKPCTEHPYSPESVRFEQCPSCVSAVADWAVAETVTASKLQTIIDIVNILETDFLCIERPPSRSE